MSFPLRPKTNAFSLLELCLVIVGIAVMAALLFPSYAHVRESSKLTQCVSQLRQVGIAFHLYAMDNRRKLPEMVYGNNHANKGQPIPITYGYAAPPFVTRLLKPPYDIKPDAKGTLGDVRALFCPAAKKPNGVPLTAPEPPVLLGGAAAPYIGYNFIYVDTRVGYAANLYQGYDNVRLGVATKNPPLLWCFTPRTFPAAGTAHRKVSNVLRLDGSVHALSHAVIDQDGASDPGLRLLENLTR